MTTANEHAPALAAALGNLLEARATDERPTARVAARQALAAYRADTLAAEPVRRTDETEARWWKSLADGNTRKLDQPADTQGGTG